ncbi:MAG: Dna2/Cas4 domain-containing protein [Candidatus Diapherotrites archaeon]|nr:Dna2/Cas4 domain-containing protein [Candidatus Diapherotrites archaeon]
MIDFNRLIEKHLERESRPKQIGRYYPSEIGTCLRKIWYSYKHPMETKAELTKIFELGNILHEFVVDVLKSEKNKEVELLEEELPFQKSYPGFIVSGRIDDLILLKENNTKILVEVKSTKSVLPIGEAQDSHKTQLQLYMHATGVHKGIVLYVDKNNLQSKAFEIEYSKEEGEKIIERFKQLHTALTSDLLPTAEAKKFENKQWLCRFCDYAEKCEKNEA